MKSSKDRPRLHQSGPYPSGYSSRATSTAAYNEARGRFISNHYAEASRLRGGGTGELGTSGLGGDGDFTWYNSRFGPRLEGGGGGCSPQPPPPAPQVYPGSGCGKPATMKLRTSFQSNFDDYLQLGNISPEYLSGNKCKLRHVEEKGGLKPECSCPARDRLESALKKKGNSICRKNHCMGTDCLIKAFKDAQDFVDSIGKVPGLAGLGISESPYFNKPQETREIKKSESKAAPPNKNDPTMALCSTQNLELLRKSVYNVSPSTYPNSSKKPAVVQEAPTALPEPSTFTSLKPKKKDDKPEKIIKEVEISSAPQVAEDTPCGEPKCKSRPKKAGVEIKESQEKVDASQKVNIQKSDKRNFTKAPNSIGERKSKKSYDYSYGNAYPQSVYGHKNCNLLRSRVPPNMGWMWNQTDPVTKIKPRSGWKPGAISVTLKQLLKIAREGFFKEAKRPMSLPKLGGKKGKAAMKTMSYTGMKKGAFEEVVEEEPEFPPTLHVHRKDGVYYVTMYPIRQDTSGVPRLDEPTNPLQFKIVKSKDSLATSSTASDMEIEFSPPAAVNRPRKLPDVIHVETQVRDQEIIDEFKKFEKKKPDKKDSKNKDKGKKKK